MAFCPKCKGEMETTAIVCPHCGYDFPSTDTRIHPDKQGLAYTTLADFALIISTAVAGFGCVMALLLSVLALFHWEFLNGLVLFPMAFILQLGMLVVFLRVQNV